MKKHLYALSLSFCLAFGLGLTATGQAQTAVTEKNGTPQAPNYDFEVWGQKYHEKDEANYPEPWGWNSSAWFEAGHSPSRFERNQSIWSSNDIRPQSKGNYSARIQVTKSKWRRNKNIFGWQDEEEVMGTMTTGALYYYDSKENSSSYIYSKFNRNYIASDISYNPEQRWAFNGRPDSVVFWAKKGLNEGRPADFTLYLHNNKELHDLANGNTENATVIGSASSKITNTEWQRISLPIQYASDETPAYLLCSFTAGNNFREVVEGDELYVDDMLFIYKPSLHIDLESKLNLPVRKGEALPTIDVPFTLKGTMSPFNLEADNVVYAELSDENGSFANPLTVGQLTTDLSGTLACQIPSDLNISHDARFKLRLRSTNYPLLSDNTVNLDVHYLYNLIVEANRPWAADLEAVDTLLREATAYTATCENIRTGLHFTEWRLNGVAVSEALSYTLTMDQDYTLTAWFDTNYYPVSVQPGIGGAITLNGTETVKSGSSYENEIIHNAVLNLNAEPDFGYHFREWRDADRTFATVNPFEWQVNESADLTAVFDTNVYELTFTAVPADMGTTTNSGAHKHFTSVNSTAEAAEYAQFLYWRKAGETEAISYEAVLPIESVSAADAYEAVFASQTFAVTTAAEPAEGGQTTGDTTYKAFPLTASAHVEATAAEGYHFTYWTYAIDGQIQSERPADNPLVFVENDHVAHAYAFTAHFDINRYALTAEYEHGMVTGLGTFDHNTAVTLNATPDNGYAFAGWFENGELVSADAEWTFNLTGDRQLQAVFEPKTYTLTFTVRGDATMGRIAQPTEATGLYAHFSTLELKAEANEGNEFRYWIINGDTADERPTFTLAIDGAKTVEAVFSPLRKQLTILNPHDDYGHTTGEGLYEHGSSVVLTAEPDFGYAFKGWLDATGEMMPGTSLTIAALTEDRTYTAVFEPIPFKLCLQNPRPEQGGFTVNGETVTEAGTVSEVCTEYPYMTEIVLTATPTSPEYRFIGWRDAATQALETGNPLTFTVLSDRQWIAEFDRLAYDVRGVAYPSEAAVIRGNGEYYLEAEAVLEAEARPGFSFVGWYDENGELLTGETQYRFTVNKAVHYAARFNRNRYTLSVAAQPAEDGKVKGGGEALYGYNTKVEAVPETGRQFEGWFDESGTLISKTAVFYPVVRQNETLTARFGLKALHIELVCEPAEAGRISRIGQSAEIPAAETDFLYGLTAQIQAEPTEFYTFSHWTDENGQTIGSPDAVAEILTFSPTADRRLTAHFSPKTFNPHVIVRPEQAGNVTFVHEAQPADEALTYGKTYTATAGTSEAHAAHYRFQGWYNAADELLSSETAYTFTFLDQTITAQFEALPVSVQTACEPAEGGQVQMTGDARYFETVTLTANAARGYRFTGWQTNGENTSLSTDNVQTLVLTGDLQLTTLFEKEIYDVAVAVWPEEAGLIEHAPRATFGERLNLQATPKAGYTFYAYENAEGNPICYEPDYTLKAEGPVHLTARFKPIAYTLKVVSSNKTLGQVKGSGRFDFGQSAPIKAWATAPGYTFSHWSLTGNGEDTLSKEAALTYDIPAENRTLYAFFKPKTLTVDLTANMPEAGSVTGGGEKTYGETVTLTAQAHDGYIWRGFSEHGLILSEETHYTFKLTEDRHIVGMFSPKMWNVTVTDLPENVKIKGTGAVAHGQEAVIEAVFSSALELIAWVDDEGNTVGYDNPLRLTVLHDYNLHPVCGPIRLPLTVTFEPAGAGQMATEGFDGDTGRFPYGEDILLEVTPAHGYTFVGWEEDGLIISRANPYAYRLFEESRLKAVFSPEGWTVTTGTNLSLGGTTSGDGIYPQGDTVEVTATPAAGFEFRHWSENGEIVSTDEVYRFVSDNDHLLMADFQIHYFQIMVDAEPSVGAKVSGSGAYSAQDTVTLTATPTNGYAFVGWECEGRRISDATTYRFIPDSDMTIVAKTQKLTASVNLIASPIEGGTVTGGGEYRIGESITVSATPNDGFNFLQWVDEQMNIISTQSSFSFTAKADVRYMAMFGSRDTTMGDPHIVLYPLPFGDEIHLEGENMDKIMWFNAFGIKVAQYEINSHSHTVMTTYNWPKGLYVYRIVRNSGKTVKGKALKL